MIVQELNRYIWTWLWYSESHVPIKYSRWFQHVNVSKKQQQIFSSCAHSGYVQSTVEVIIHSSNTWTEGLSNFFLMKGVNMLEYVYIYEYYSEGKIEGFYMLSTLQKHISNDFHEIFRAGYKWHTHFGDIWDHYLVQEFCWWRIHVWKQHYRKIYDF